MLLRLIFAFYLVRIADSYNTNPTQWSCLESTNEPSPPPTLPSCLPGYVIDIENVIFESTTDGSCTGTTLCQVENKNALLFACNRKRTCQVDAKDLRFHVNGTCGSTKRFFTKYRCLPVIQEQKDYLCESPTTRRATLGDINLSCERNYRLHITMASIGISIKPQDDQTKARFKCNKDTPWICTQYVSDVYRSVCHNQLRPGQDDQCKIRYSDRPVLKDCPHGTGSNYSMVEYSCIPGRNERDLRTA